MLLHPAVFNIRNRKILRLKYDLPEEPLSDCPASLCCPICARELARKSVQTSSCKHRKWLRLRQI